MKDIVIIGAGGFGREVAWLIEDINRENKEWNILGFVDDNNELLGSEINGYRVIGNIDWLKKQKLNVVNAIGNPMVKSKIMYELEYSANIYPVLIHPSVIISNKLRIGEGTIICAGNIITVNIEIGKHVIVNLGCTIGHDVKLGDFTTVLPGVNISGFVDIGECVSLGTGASIIQNLIVGNNSIIGAGSVVVKNIPEKCTAVGIPSRIIKYHD